MTVIQLVQKLCVYVYAAHMRINTHISTDEQ